MSSQAPEPKRSSNQWIVDACSLELSIHRGLFQLAICPSLGLWLSGLLLYFGLTLICTILEDIWKFSDGLTAVLKILVLAASIGVPLVAAAVGAWRERKRLIEESQNAQASANLPSGRQFGIVQGVLGEIWQGLRGKTAPPRLLWREGGGLIGHAYDGPAGQAIEVSSELARQVLRHDPLSLSILRHETAHLVHKDISAIRQISVFAAAAGIGAKTSICVGIAAALVLVVVSDFGRFPLTPTFGHYVAFHLAVLLASLIVLAPLLAGLYILRRYLGFIFSLIETRADASAGVWGDGVEAFGRQLAADPKRVKSTLMNIGLAYISPRLVHLPTTAREVLLASPERLVTPKLSYFAAAIFVVWLLQFHQGEQTWDRLVMALVVSAFQAMCIATVFLARDKVQFSWPRLAAIAFAMTMSLSITRINFDGLAYLLEDLTAALVSPGGFGPADDSNYWKDTLDTAVEYLGHVYNGFGGWLFPFMVAINTFGLKTLSRASGRLPMLLTVIGAATATFVTAFFVAEAELEEAVEKVWFDLPFVVSSQWTILPEGFRGAIGTYLLGLRDLTDQVQKMSFIEGIALAAPVVICLVYVYSVQAWAVGDQHLRLWLRKNTGA